MGVCLGLFIFNATRDLVLDPSRGWERCGRLKRGQAEHVPNVGCSFGSAPILTAMVLAFDGNMKAFLTSHVHSHNRSMEGVFLL